MIFLATSPAFYCGLSLNWLNPVQLSRRPNTLLFTSRVGKVYQIYAAVLCLLPRPLGTTFWCHKSKGLRSPRPVLSLLVRP